MTGLLQRGKQWMIGAAVGAGALLLAGVAGWHYLSPSGYIALDVNPSIEISTNRLDRVVSVKAANKDGEKLLEGYRLTDRDLDDVIEDIVDRMIFNGYLDNAKENEVLITVDDENAPRESLEAVNRKVADYLDARRIEAQVLGQTLDVDRALREEARKNGISAGKMALVEQMLSGSREFTAEELAKMRVSDLIAYAVEKNIPVKTLENQLERLEKQFKNRGYDELEEALDDHMDRLEDLTEPKGHDDDWDDLDDHDDDRYDDDDDWDDAHDDDDDNDWDDSRDRQNSGKRKPASASSSPAKDYQEKYYRDFDDADDHDDYDDHDDDRYDDDDDWDDAHDDDHDDDWDDADDHDDDDDWDDDERDDD